MPMPPPSRLDILIPVYPGVDLLDVAAPLEVFSWAADEVKGRCRLRVRVAAARRAPVRTRAGVALQPDCTFARAGRVDVLWVPGGSVAALQAEMRRASFLARLRRWSEGARLVTSVCEGAMLLAAAGLLDGRRATTHWAFLPCLAQYPAIRVVGAAEGFPRFVVDPEADDDPAPGTRVTGAGISAGLDEALQIVRMLFGREVAEAVQRTTQYFPRPPVDATLTPATDCPLGAPR